MDSITTIPTNYIHVNNPRVANIPQLTRVESGPLKGRYYTDGTNKYVSVTSFLAAKPNPGLMKWKERVGEKEAARVSLKATTKGSAVHALAEATLRNQKTVLDESLISRHEWNAFQGVLKRINNIYLIERPVFSPKLKLAGTPDCIAEFDGVLSVIDFKTSRRMKEESYIEDYFLQATAYGEMFTGLTDIPVEQIVIAISINDNYPQVFIRDAKDYRETLITRLKEYEPRLFSEVSI